MSTTTRTRRSVDDWNALACEMIETNQKLSDPEVAKRVGTNAAAVRVALALQGFDGGLEPLEIEPLAVSGGPKAIAKRVAQLRREKTPWWKIVVAAKKAGKPLSYNDLREMLAKYDYTQKGESSSNGSAAD